jgi:hypothetical protein
VTNQPPTPAASQPTLEPQLESALSGVGGKEWKVEKMMDVPADHAAMSRGKDTLFDAALELRHHAWLARFRKANYENKHNELSPCACNDIAGYVDQFIVKVLKATSPARERDWQARAELAESRLAELYSLITANHHDDPHEEQVNELRATIGHAEENINNLGRIAALEQRVAELEGELRQWGGNPH